MVLADTTRSQLRVNVLFKGSRPPQVACEVVCVFEQGNLVEYWLKCSSIVSLLLALEAIASNGVLVAMGGLDGNVYRFLPRSPNELLKSLTSSTTLPSNTTIVVQPCNGNIHKVVEVLSPRAMKISLRPGLTELRVHLVKPLNVEQLFDNGIRLLKPTTIPPILLKPRKATKTKGSLIKQPPNHLK